MGVVGREGIGVEDLEMTPFSLLSFGSAQQRSSELVNTGGTEGALLFAASLLNIGDDGARRGGGTKEMCGLNLGLTDLR